MPNYDLRSIYMERALQAEHWAALFAEGYYKDSWLGIAAEYRALAQGKKHSHAPICGTALTAAVQNPQQLPNAEAASDDPLAVPPPAPFGKA